MVKGWGSMNRLSANFFSIVVPVLLLAASGQAGTIGNPTISAAQFDTCNGCTFVLLQAFPGTDAGENVVSYSLFAFNAGNPITPLIFTEAGGIFTVTGVGTTQNIISTGAQSFSFGLTDGSSLVGSNTFFGYRDGTVSTGTGAAAKDTIAFSGPGPGVQIQFFGAAGPGPSPNIYVGEAFNSAGGTTVAGGPELGGLAYLSQNLPRIYSLQATDAAISSVPEPGAIFLMLGGAIMLWLGRRRLA
jgi:hypothetical protein